jgi:hypothetical protein
LSQLSQLRAAGTCLAAEIISIKGLKADENCH